MDEISDLYPQGAIEKSKQHYTKQYLRTCLATGDRRLIAHVSDAGLDGLLVESFDSFDGARTLINWVGAQTKGNGIGTALIEDCLKRAEREAKDVVALGVSVQNAAAQRLYARLGFRKGAVYDNNTMLLMGYVVPKEK
jgi:RimJ/RimL family protein N-acetyltransferase